MTRLESIQARHDLSLSARLEWGRVLTSHELRCLLAVAEVAEWLLAFHAAAGRLPRGGLDDLRRELAPLLEEAS